LSFQVIPGLVGSPNALDLGLITIDPEDGLKRGFEMARIKHPRKGLPRRMESISSLSILRFQNFSIKLVEFAFDKPHYFPPIVLTAAQSWCEYEPHFRRTIRRQF
jgi:hypothetical protein